MRPTPAETIEGVVRILRDTVAPAVTDAHARGQLAQLMGVLGQVDWNDAGRRLHAQLVRTVDLLGECAAWAATQPGFDAVVVPLLPPTDAAFDIVNEALAEARGALAAFIDALHGWRTLHGQASSTELFDRIAATLAS